MSTAGELGPAAVQTDLKDGADEPAGRLCHVDHVRHEREALQLELGDVGLQQHIDLGTRLLHALLHRDRHPLQQL